MALAVLPGEIIAPTRDEWRDKYLRSYALRDPEALTGADEQPWIDASCLADQLVIQSENAKSIGRGVLLSEATGDRLDQRGAVLGVPRAPASGSSGLVQIKTSIGGTDIDADVHELMHESTGVIFKVTASAHYNDGDSVPITANATGTQTNLDPETVLVWTAPPPGCFPTATVVELPDGTGLSGGREREEDDGYRERLAEEEANPANSGNDAEYQRLTENATAHGVPVERAFTYPAFDGAGTTAVAFTMKPQRSGGSRVPNPTQIATVESYVVDEMPGDDSPAYMTIAGEAKNVVFKIRWAKGARGWTDAVPWPPYRSSTDSPGRIRVQSATGPLNFILETAVGGYAGITSPVAGQTIAFYNTAAARFRRKKILSVTGTGPWTIVCDGTAGASDTSYTPVVGRRAMPWSDSLDSIVASVLAYFDQLGPGELFATFYDAGRRQRRNPENPGSWPNAVSNRIVDPFFQLSTVYDAELVDTPGTAPTIGTPGVLVYLFELADLAVFPK